MGKLWCGGCWEPDELCECPETETAKYLREHGGLEKVIEEHRGLVVERGGKEPAVDQWEQWARDISRKMAKAREEGLRDGLNVSHPEMLKVIESLISERDRLQAALDELSNLDQELGLE